MLRTDASPDQDRLAPAEVADTYNKCLATFATLVRLWQGYPHTVDDIISTRALEVYGRLRTWGEESRAALPAAARGSLDDTLRKDEELRFMVHDILLRIFRQIQWGMHIYPR